MEDPSVLKAKAHSPPLFYASDQVREVISCTILNSFSTHTPILLTSFHLPFQDTGTEAWLELHFQSLSGGFHCVKVDIVEYILCCRVDVTRNRRNESHDIYRAAGTAEPWAASQYALIEATAPVASERVWIKEAVTTGDRARLIAGGHSGRRLDRSGRHS